MNFVSEYLKHNPIPLNKTTYHITPEAVKAALKMVNENKEWIKKTNNKTNYAVIINGKQFTLEYEEMVELLVGLQSAEVGNEAFVLAKLKAEIMMQDVPASSY